MGSRWTLLVVAVMATTPWACSGKGVLVSARYYDSAGKELREHVSRPSALGPLASVEYVVLSSDTLGGRGPTSWSSGPDHLEWTSR